jgi:hypothetical protein
LILAQPGTAKQGELLDELADTARLADSDHMRFEPTVMAQDLATSVEHLSAAVEAIPTDRLDQSDAELLVASVEASLAVLRNLINKFALGPVGHSCAARSESACPDPGQLNVGPGEYSHDLARTVGVRLRSYGCRLSRPADHDHSRRVSGVE